MSVPVEAVRRKMGRRTGGDRRCFSYTVHAPERRVIKERRAYDRRVSHGICQKTKF